MEPHRLVHWYDTERHRIACGAAGQSNSTKHARSVSCAECLALVARALPVAKPLGVVSHN
jgi:3-hydroxyisobutyrate dehydrogenase-like beta-hydroxyacid dehydrogenase